MTVLCAQCSSPMAMPFICKFCGERFCGNHHLPENHGCLGLVKFKGEREKGLGRWIYEPFHKRYAGRVGREIRRPLKEWLLRAVGFMDARKVLYAVIVLIVALTIWQSLPDL